MMRHIGILMKEESKLSTKIRPDTSRRVTGVYAKLEDMIRDKTAAQERMDDRASEAGGICFQSGLW